jgi:hypothetical protein
LHILGDYLVFFLRVRAFVQGEPGGGGYQLLFFRLVDRVACTHMGKARDCEPNGLSYCTSSLIPDAIGQKKV